MTLVRDPKKKIWVERSEEAEAAGDETPAAPKAEDAEE